MSSISSSPALSSAEKITPYLWFLFIVCFLSNVLGGTASTLMSVYLPVVVKDLLGQVTDERMSDVSAYINALYFVGWAIGGFVWGMIADQIGRAKALSMCVGMFGLFTILKGFAPSLEIMLVFQFLCGFGVGGVIVVNTTLLTEAWPERTRALFIGFVSIGFPVGIFSSGAVNYFVSSWRQGFLMGILPLTLGIISFFALRESQKWEIAQTNQSGSNDRLSAYRLNLLNGSVIFGSMLIGLWANFFVGANMGAKPARKLRWSE